jgi:hypothetical protein
MVLALQYVTDLAHHDAQPTMCLRFVWVRMWYARKEVVQRPICEKPGCAQSSRSISPSRQPPSRTALRKHRNIGHKTYTRNKMQDARKVDNDYGDAFRGATRREHESNSAAIVCSLKTLKMDRGSEIFKRDRISRNAMRPQEKQVEDDRDEDHKCFAMLEPLRKFLGLDASQRKRRKHGFEYFDTWAEPQHQRRTFKHATAATPETICESISDDGSYNRGTANNNFNVAPPLIGALKQLEGWDMLDLTRGLGFDDVSAAKAWTVLNEMSLKTNARTSRTWKP